MPLRCPACVEILAAFEAGPVMFDWCQGCGSLWVDPAELGRVPTAARALAKLGRLAANPRYCARCHATTPAAEKTCGTCHQATAQCPLCRDQPLKAIAVGSGTLDACPSCHGLWIASGDLAELGRSGELSVHLEDHLGRSAGKTVDGPTCAQCGASLAGRIAWRRNGVTCCATCTTAGMRRRGTGPRKGARAEPGIGVLEVLGRVLEFIEGGLPPFEGRR